MKDQKLQSGLWSLLLLAICGGAIAIAMRNATAPSETPMRTVDWVRLIDSGGVQERRLALTNLVAVDPAEIDLAVAASKRALEDPEPPVRVEAVTALARFATLPSPGTSSLNVERARGIAGRLLEMCREDDDAGVRAVAAGVVSSIYQALVKAGNTPGDTDTSDPLRAEALVAAFDAGILRDSATRVTLVTAIQRLGALSIVASPGLLSVLDDPTHFVRGQALVALSHFSGGVDPAIPVLLHDIATNTDQYPPDYAEVVRRIRPSPAALPKLIDGLKSDNGLVRATAATMVSRMEPTPRSAAPVVVAAVQKALAADRAGAEEEDIPDPPPSGAPAGVAPSAGGSLRQLPPGSVSPDLALALAKLAPPEEAVSLLLRLAKRPGAASRSAAAEGLAELGPAAHAAIPTLIANLKEALARGGRSSAVYGSSTARALGRIAPAAPDAQAESAGVLAVLADALKSRSSGVRAAAARALGSFGPRAASFLPKIRGLLEDRTGPVRDAAKEAIEKLEPPAIPARDAKSRGQLGSR